MKVETIKQADAHADVNKDYGGYVATRLVKQRNRHIYVSKTDVGTYSIRIRTLIMHDGKRKIMHSYIHLTEEAMLGVIQAVISLDGRDQQSEASHDNN
jgi:hypothetical protein